jgi:hypothetical protein
MDSEIVAIEDAVRRAQLASDTEFLESILDEDFKFITPQGRLVTKREDIDQYKSGYLKLSVVEISDQNITMFDHIAISRFKAKFEGQAGKYDFSATFLFTRVYAKVRESWKMVAGHSTEIK